MASIGEASAHVAECVDKATSSDAFLDEARGAIEQALGAFSGIVLGSENSLSADAGNVLSGVAEEIDAVKEQIRAGITAAETLLSKW